MDCQEDDFSLFDVGTASEHEELCYRKLWRAILLSALTDAEGNGRMLGVSRTGRKRAILRARQWLTADTEDLRMTCDLAGFTSHALLRYTRGRYGETHKHLPRKRMREPN